METYIASTAYMFEAILSGLLITGVTGMLGIRIAKKFGFMDIPGIAPHKKHKHPTPIAGGIALALTIVILIGSFAILRDAEIIKFLIPAIVIFGFGLLDDTKRLLPKWKLAGQIVASIILIALGIAVQLFESDDFLFNMPDLINIFLDWGLTAFWVIGITNAFNLVDSMDGLSVGLSAWAFGFFMLATFDSQQFALSFFSAAMVGTCITLNFFNSSPARLFLGDGGAQLFGFLLAVIAILYTPSAASQSSSWFVPIMLVGVPIFDTTLVFFSRLRRRQPFYIGGSDHTYHRLVSFGLDPAHAVTIMHMAALTLECVAFIAFSLAPLYANLIFAASLAVGVVVFFMMDHPKRWP